VSSAVSNYMLSKPIIDAGYPPKLINMSQHKRTVFNTPLPGNADL